jgi:hypothetical protein
MTNSLELLDKSKEIIISQVEEAQYQIDKVATFEEAFKTDVTKYVKMKKNFAYLSWSYAVTFLKYNYPDSIIKKVRHYSDETGWWVETYVQLSPSGEKHYESYPVFEHRAKTATEAGGMYPIEKPNAMDINRAYQRCLTRNIAIATGIGMYLYSGEDLPKEDVSLGSEDFKWFVRNFIPIIFKRVEAGEYNYKNFVKLVEGLFYGKIDIEDIKRSVQ